MTNKSIRQLFDAVEQQAQKAAHGSAGPEDKGKAEESGASAKQAAPAERVWQALIKLLGGAEGIPEDMLADAVISAWEAAEKGMPGKDRPDSEEKGVAARELIEEPKKRALFEGAEAGVPMPIRGGAIGAEPVDYESMSGKQFRQLKKQLQKAAAQGVRVKL